VRARADAVGRDKRSARAFSAVDAPRASADGAAAPLTLDECKAAAGPAAGGCTYRAAAAAFLAATPAFARDWQHVPAGFAGADVWG
jgi:hypothetical protein